MKFGVNEEVNKVLSAREDNPVAATGSGETTQGGRETLPPLLPFPQRHGNILPIQMKNLVTKKPDTDPITPVTMFIYLFISSDGS